MAPDLGAVPEGMRPTLAVFQSALELSRSCQLHPDLTSQTFGYLFFFCNASLFNTLMERGGGSKGVLRGSRGSLGGPRGSRWFLGAVVGDLSVPGGPRGVLGGS